jgi:hypothetical protein
MDFGNTWIDGPLAKRKKQEWLIGFFWMCESHERRRVLLSLPIARP